MLDETPTRRTHGTVAVLALLLGVLFSSVTVPAARAADARSAAIGHADVVKPAAKLRTTARSQADEPDDLLTGAAGSQVETTVIGSRPAVQPAPSPASAEPSNRTSAYRARAPPAA